MNAYEGSYITPEKYTEFVKDGKFQLLWYSQDIAKFLKCCEELSLVFRYNSYCTDVYSTITLNSSYWSHIGHDMWFLIKLFKKYGLKHGAEKISVFLEKDGDCGVWYELSTLDGGMNWFIKDKIICNDGI